jgi:hypothetical protein
MTGVAPLCGYYNQYYLYYLTCCFLFYALFNLATKENSPRFLSIVVFTIFYSTHQGSVYASGGASLPMSSGAVSARSGSSAEAFLRVIALIAALAFSLAGLCGRIFGPAANAAFFPLREVCIKQWPIIVHVNSYYSEFPHSENLNPNLRIKDLKA